MKLAIHVCAELEWRFTKSLRKICRDSLTRHPFGECFEDLIGKHRALIYESGATKTRSAAACQYIIDRWRPDAIINLGTCGGVAEGIDKGDLVLATRTFQYDVRQRFGKPSKRFDRGLTVDLDTSWVRATGYSRIIHKGLIASADQDLDYEQRRSLERMGALAADWESASIATVCALNGVRCLILRGVSDIPTKAGLSGARAQERDYVQRTRVIMEELFAAVARLEFCH